MQEQELEDRIFEIFARANSESDIAGSFDALADELTRARSEHEKVKALDDALFRRDFETRVSC